MARTFEDRVNAANTAYEAGFTSKAAQKRALDELNRAYDMLRDQANDDIRKFAPYQFQGRDLTASEWASRSAYFEARQLPFDLHAIRPHHGELMSIHTVDPVDLQLLIDLRAAIKAAPVVKIERSAEVERVVKVREGILDLMKRRGEQYNRALDLAEIFGRLPVTANVHVVTNAHGTTFLRAFFYLSGEFTPLNVILAAADELARREGGQ